MEEYELKPTQHDMTETGAKCKYQTCMVIRNTNNNKDKMFSLQRCPVVGWQRAHIAARLSPQGLSQAPGYPITVRNTPVQGHL